MKSFGTRLRRLFGLSWWVAVLAVFGLFPWQLLAQTDSDDEDADEAATPTAEQVMKVESKSGPYKITLDRVRRQDGGKITMVESGFPPVIENGSMQSETKTFPGGSVTTGGGGGGGGSGGVFHIPNLILDVGVTGPKTHKNCQLLCTVNGLVKAVDDQGREADSPPCEGWVRTELVGVDYRREPGRTALHLALAPGDPAARYLKSVSGQLLVAEGRLTTIAFEDEALSRPTAKKANGISARLEKVAQSSDGIDVKLDVSGTANKQAKTRAMDNPMAHMQQMRLANAPGRVKVVLEDSDGKTHSPTSQSSQGGGSKSFSNNSGGSFGSGSSGGSWGASGGSSSGGSSGSVSKSFGPGSKPSSFSSNDSTPGQTCHFDPLPNGVTVKAIKITVTDLVESPKSIPFHFENIQLPDSHK